MYEWFNKEDLETQFFALEFPENSIWREMESNLLLLGDRVEWLIKLTETFPEQVKAGLEGINAQPETLEHGE